MTVQVSELSWQQLDALWNTIGLSGAAHSENMQRREALHAVYSYLSSNMANDWFLPVTMNTDGYYQRECTLCGQLILEQDRRRHLVELHHADVTRGTVLKPVPNFSSRAWIDLQEALVSSYPSTSIYSKWSDEGDIREIVRRNIAIIEHNRKVVTDMEPSMLVDTFADKGKCIFGCVDAKLTAVKTLRDHIVHAHLTDFGYEDEEVA